MSGKSEEAAHVASNPCFTHISPEVAATIWKNVEVEERANSQAFSTLYFACMAQLVASCCRW